MFPLNPFFGICPFTDTPIEAYVDLLCTKGDLPAFLTLLGLEWPVDDTVRCIRFTCLSFQSDSWPELSLEKRQGSFKVPDAGYFEDLNAVDSMINWDNLEDMQRVVNTNGIPFSKKNVWLALCFAACWSIQTASTSYWTLALSKNHSMIGFTGPFTYIIICRLYRNMFVQLPCTTNYHIHSCPCANVHVASWWVILLCIQCK